MYMKNIVYIIILVSNFIFAQNEANQLFDEANDLYKKEKYTEAVDKYESILTIGKYESSELYFNLGNCYYKLGKVAPSIYNYEKALLLKPEDRDIKTNLIFAQKTAIDDISIVPNVGFSNFIYKISLWFHYDVWAWITVGFSMLFLISFVFYYFSGRTIIKRTFFLGMFVFIGCMVIALTFAFLQKRFERTIRPAIVFEEVTNLKSEAKNSSKSLKVLHEGTKVYVKETLDNWKRVELTDKTEGWIKKDAIIELKK
jgi:tetratricopeptide (TPR) repeat protein